MAQTTKMAVPERSTKRQRASSAEMQARIDALEAELQEAQARETATAEVLYYRSSIRHRATSPVFDAILERAIRLCDAVFGSLLSYDGKHFENVALRNVPDAFAEFANPGRFHSPVTIPQPPLMSRNIEQCLAHRRS